MSTTQSDIPRRVIASVRSVLAARLKGTVPEDQKIASCPDLRELGLDSLGAVNLMLTLETEFDLFIPQDRMKPQNFRSVAAMVALLSTISQAA